ncbi:hypothetical protein Taro_030270 [Colocasia esculenta]|uniref:Uncharacterized protein n=1 Tax=Colocasia esculenta TaxID=4460 RepID=A0A843VRH7_COLES|nr:hypothetical protein [Colocasia esculenta]
MQLANMQESNSLAVASVEFSEDFSSSLASCWETAAKWSLYSSHDDLQRLIKQVLSWNIRSLSQKNRPHSTPVEQNIRGSDLPPDMIDVSDQSFGKCGNFSASSPGEVIYHLVVEGIDVKYRIDDNSNIMVENASLSDAVNCTRDRQNFITWTDKWA